MHHGIEDNTFDYLHIIIIFYFFYYPNQFYFDLFVYKHELVTFVRVVTNAHPKPLVTFFITPYLSY
jgi:hypothetical protein